MTDFMSFALGVILGIGLLLVLVLNAMSDED